MRVRKTFAAGFAILVIIAAFLGLAPQQTNLSGYAQGDKVLHITTFFLLTICFYWVLEVSRRRAVNSTLMVVTAGLGVGSEIVQGFLPNGREFDLYDIAANLAGSLVALGICSWYHKRMLDRRRAARRYNLVPGDEQDLDVELGEHDLDHDHDHDHDSETPPSITVVPPQPTVTEQLDNWDENAEDWEEPENDVEHKQAAEKAKASSPVGASESGATGESVDSTPPIKN